MKILIVGKSYVSCLKKAWESMRGEHENISLDFYASNASSIASTEFKDGKIIPTDESVRKSFLITSRKSGEIDLKNYDVIIMYGINSNLSRMIDIYNNIDTNVYSSKFRDNAVLYSNIASDRLFRMRHMAGGRNWYVSPAPNTVKIPSGASMQDLKISKGEFDFWRERVSHIFEANGFSYIPQPFETLLSLKYTKPEFNIGAVGLGSSPSQDGYKDLKLDPDGVHMNEAFGRIALRDIFSNVYKEERRENG